MPTTTPTFRAPALGAVLLLAAIPAPAAVFFDLEDGALEERAARIVVGRITGAEAAPGHAIDYRVEVEATVRGNPLDELTLRLPGGVRDGLALVIPGTPRLRPDDRTLLFLRPGADSTFDLSHPFLGAFLIVPGDHGSEIAVRASDAHPLAGPWHGLRHDDGLDRDLASFVRWLTDRGRGDRRAPDYFLQPRPVAKSLRDDAAKWEPVVSSPEPEPYGCGDFGGHRIRWFDFEGGGSVGWRTHFSGQDGLPDGGISNLRVAIESWKTDPHSIIRLEYSGLTSADNGFAGTDGVNTLLFGDPRDQIPGTFENNGLLALGGAWFLCELREHRGDLFHPIIEADIVTQDGLENFLAASPHLRRAAEEIFAHELGHTLGFAHTPEPQALMFAFAHDDGRGAALDVDDLRGAFDLYGNSGLPPPPEAPEDLEATGVFATAVMLEWVDTSTVESNFRLERRHGEGDFAPIVAIAADRDSFLDPTVDPETAYGYRIRAQNAAGASEYSGEVTLTTAADSRPEAPSNLRAAPLSSRIIRLTWQDNATDETSFALAVLNRTTSTWVEIPFAVPPDTTSVRVVELHPGVDYTFRVRARNAYGTSGPSNSASATTYVDDNGCVAGENELCLLGGRFRARVSFSDPAIGGGVMNAAAIPSTDQTGMFWFFGPENVELVVKMIDGRDANGHFWVFYGGITDLKFDLEIEDTVTGHTAVYQNSRGDICGNADVLAFPGTLTGDVGGPTARILPKAVLPEEVPTNYVDAVGVHVGDEPLARANAVTPEPITGGDCVRGPDHLCLLDGRLRVEVGWIDRHGSGQEGEGRAVVLSEESGYFWFFAPENLEMVVKALDGRGVNGYLWFFFGVLTDLEYSITVTDTVTGKVRIYNNPPGSLCGVADILAFELEP